MHVIRESAVPARDAVHHLLIIPKRAMRRAKVHGDLAVAFRTIATIDASTHSSRECPLRGLSMFAVA